MKTLFTFLMLFSILHATAQDHTQWVYQTEGRIYSSPVIDNQNLFFGSGDHHLYALDKETGTLAWKFQTGGAVHSNPAMYNNMVLFSSADGFVYALDKNQGTLVWNFQTQGEKMQDIWDYYLSSPVINDNTVYFGSGDGYMYAIDANTGELKWKYHSEDIIHADPLVSEHRVYFGNYKGVFTALDADSGNLLWQFKTMGSEYFPQGEVPKAAVIGNNTLYFGSRDYHVYAIDARTGQPHENWIMTDKGSWVISTPLMLGENLYFGTSDTHKFYCVNSSDGSVVWETSLPMRVFGSAAAYNDVVYFGCFDGIVRGVNPASGEIVWSYQTRGSKENYSVIFDESGKFKEGFELYGRQYLESERQIQSLGSVHSTPAIENNIMYFGSSDGGMYSVKLGGR
jgi:eukaryotic-like serine/threonine-protein kinase